MAGGGSAPAIRHALLLLMALHRAALRTAFPPRRFAWETGNAGNAARM
jgi:hypothetical protein